MANKDIPQKWTGEEVEVSIRTDVPEESTGKLKTVNDAGIVVHRQKGGRQGLRAHGVLPLADR